MFQVCMIYATSNFPEPLFFIRYKVIKYDILIFQPFGLLYGKNQWSTEVFPGSSFSFGVHDNDGEAGRLACFTIELCLHLRFIR